ncbi:MAG: hypothetical protein E7657_01070 [Ruminococcaceae bacterium]|nr:hypothetical protein [Oscillospiraceae bacterium]
MEACALSGRKPVKQWIYERRMPILYVVLAIAFLAMAYVHIKAVMVAKTMIPIMDYWKWIAVYGQKVLDGTVTFADWFQSDAGQHIQPLCMMINFGVLKLFHFDVLPLVVGGMIFRVLMAGGFMALFVLHFRKEEKSPVMLGLCAVVIGFSVLNLNQWEMITQPFSLTSICRVALFYLSFYLTDKFVSKIEERSAKGNVVYAACLGVYCGLLTVFVSAAYFVGHLVAIGLAILWCAWCRRESFRKFVLPAIVWGTLSLAGAIVYYAIVSGRAGYATAEPTFFELLILLAEGVCCFWGSVFVHQNISNALGTAAAVMIGLLLLQYIIIVTVCYMRKNKDGKNTFPLICVLYALIISVVISFGRATVFGADTMTSSRYVVESTIGLFGTAWMTYDVFLKNRASVLFRCGAYAFAILSLVLLMHAAKTESDTAIYRKIYNEDIRDKMLIIDTLADEDLASFQANSPDDIRYCVEFFKENGLSIFRETK